MAIDLNKAAQTVAFEMFHLRYYAEVYESCPANDRFRAVFGYRIGSAYEYAFLLHLRVLLDFFYKKPKKDDVWVGHFKANPGFSAVYRRELYKAPRGTSRLKDHLHKRLAHFTEFRWTNKVHPGLEDYRPYWIELLKLIDKFEVALTGVPKEYFDERMKHFMDKRDHELYIRKPRAKRKTK